MSRKVSDCSSLSRHTVLFVGIAGTNLMPDNNVYVDWIIGLVAFRCAERTEYEIEVAYGCVADLD